PGERWRGSSGAGHYGDFVNQIDAEVGRLVAALDASGLGSNTLLVFTSDNGAHWPPADIDRWGHASNLAWRGQKADIHEAGHRVPFLVRWTDVVDPNTVQDETICLTDLYATSLAVAGKEGERRTADAADLGGEDSVDLVPMLKTGDARALEAREGIVHHSLDGMFAIRVGDWKLVEGLGSGGFTAPRRTSPPETGPTVQLYDLATDPGETTNLAAKNPAEVARLQAILDRVRVAPRSVR
ncbi:MAG: sulfatase, partial [Phycisphaerae bacterium]